MPQGLLLCAQRVERVFAKWSAWMRFYISRCNPWGCFLLGEAHLVICLKIAYHCPTDDGEGEVAGF